MTKKDLYKTTTALIVIIILSSVFIGYEKAYTKPNNTFNYPISEKDNSNKISEDQSFPQYSFSVRCPAILRDVSNQGNDDFEFNYAGNTKEAFYQIMIIRLSASLDETAIRGFISNQGGGRFTEFGTERLLAYQLNDYIHQGYKGRGITIVRNSLMYVFNVMAKEDLKSKYDNFINSVSFTGKLSVKTNNSIYKEYKKQGYGAFSISYPHDWVLMENPNQYVNLFVKSIKQSYGESEANFNIIISTDTNSLESKFNTTQKQLRENIPEYVLLTKEYIKVNGLDCLRTEARANMQGRLIRSTGYQLKKRDNTTYTITFTVEEDKYGQYIQVFDNIIKSFKLL